MRRIATENPSYHQLSGYWVIGFPWFEVSEQKNRSGKMSNHKERLYLETHTSTTRASFRAFYNALASLNLSTDKINAQWDGVCSQMFFSAPGWKTQLVQLQTLAVMLNQFAFDFYRLEQRKCGFFRRVSK